MISYNLTPEFHGLPDHNSCGNTQRICCDLTESFRVYKSILDDYAMKHEIGHPLNTDFIYETKFQSDILREIAHALKPPSHSEYSQIFSLFSPELPKPKPQKPQLQKPESQKGTVNTFHINDLASLSITPMGTRINEFSFSSRVLYTWNWLGSYRADSVGEHINHIKDKHKWMTGVDGIGGTCVGNMRAWKNKINSALHVVCCDSRVSADFIGAVAFALINLQIGGFACIRMVGVPNISQCGIIHVMAQCFTETYMIHGTQDGVYLVGVGLLKIDPQYKNWLYKVVDLATGSNVPFDDTVDISWIVGKITDSLKSIYISRCKYYQCVLRAYDIIGSLSSVSQVKQFMSELLAKQCLDDV